MANVTLSSIISFGFPYIKHQVFTSSGTFTLPSTAAHSVDYDIIAGGGAGGGETSGYNRVHGGGGGGERKKGSIVLSPATSYPVVVGAGGIGRSTGTDRAANGGNSSFAGITAVGGKGAYLPPSTINGGEAGNGAPPVVAYVNYYTFDSGGGGQAAFPGAGGFDGVCSGGSGANTSSPQILGVGGGGNGGYPGSTSGGDATTPGSGGGGGYKASTDASTTGGSGYRGEVRITYWDSVP